jgi:hypothetical protein
MPEFETDKPKNGAAKPDNGAKLLLLIFIVLIIVLFLKIAQSSDSSFIKSNEKTKAEPNSGSAFGFDSQRATVTPVEIVKFVPDANLASGYLSDLFSSFAWLSKASTTLFLDESTTALVFPPVYEFLQSYEATNIAPIKDEKNNESCLNFLGSPKCLKVSGKVLYFNNKKIGLPSEIAKENILKITTGALETKWLVGIVTGRNSDERGFVYFFDGEKFWPLITKNTEQKIEPQYGRKGGGIYFGGKDDDFLILYSGYDGVAFYYHIGQLKNVSSFFGLRVTGEGFAAKIFRVDNSRGSVFYICSETENKPKLIKVWSRQPGELMGSLNFSPFLFNDSRWSLSATCRLLSSSQPIKIGITPQTDDSTEDFIFTDYGFDNSQGREVVSANVEQAKNSLEPEKIRKILAAKIGAVELNSASSDDFKFYFSSTLGSGEQNWQETKPGHWSEINNPTGEIYWRAVFVNQPGDSDYSPWFNTLNSLEYKIEANH